MTPAELDHAEREQRSTLAQTSLRDAIDHMSRVRDLCLHRSESKRALSVAITNAETALLWLCAGVS